MYVPHRYRVTDSRTIDEFVRAHGFGLLVTSRDGAPTGTHVPIELLATPEGRVLEGHVARANPHWRSMADGARALAVFLGPHDGHRGLPHPRRPCRGIIQAQSEPRRRQPCACDGQAS